MPEWEYTTINLSDVPIKILVDDVLNNVGEEGWELIAITANHIAYLKRQVAVRRPARGSSRTPSAPPEPTS